MRSNCKWENRRFPLPFNLETMILVFKVVVCLPRFSLLLFAVHVPSSPVFVFTPFASPLPPLPVGEGRKPIQRRTQMAQF